MWAVADSYEAYVGRWSRQVADVFTGWLDRPGGHWLDVGCGTGALTSTALVQADPARIVGIDPSEPFLAEARARLTDPRATFTVGDAMSLRLAAARFDTVVSGLALNFVPDPTRAAAEMVRVAAPGSTVAAYVWDYAGGMQMMRHFWDAAVHLDPAVAELDEAARFPVCRPEALGDSWTAAGLAAVDVRAIGIPTRFGVFDEYWRPFLGGQGAAPAYAMSLPEPRRDALREVLRERLPVAADGAIELAATAWAVRGTVR